MISREFCYIAHVVFIVVFKTVVIALSAIIFRLVFAFIYTQIQKICKMPILLSKEKCWYFDKCIGKDV